MTDFASAYCELGVQIDRLIDTRKFSYELGRTQLAPASDTCTERNISYYMDVWLNVSPQYRFKQGWFFPSEIL